MRYSKTIARMFVGALALAMPFGLAACSNSSGTGTGSETSSEPAKTFADAQAMMEAIWNEQEEDTKPAVFGGMGEETADGMPLAISLEEPDTVAATFNVPQTLVEQSKDASVMMNAMMANAFTASAWQLKDSAGKDELVDEIKTTLTSTHWMCTFPDEYAIGVYGDEIVVVYGYTDQVDPFVKAMKAACPGIDVQSGTFE